MVEEVRNSKEKPVSPQGKTGFFVGSGYTTSEGVAMFEGRDRRVIEPTFSLGASRCPYCGGDTHEDRFLFSGLKRVVGCCRQWVASRAEVDPERVVELGEPMCPQVLPLSKKSRAHHVPSDQEKAASPRYWEGLW